MGRLKQHGTDGEDEIGHSHQWMGQPFWLEFCKEKNTREEDWMEAEKHRLGAWTSEEVPPPEHQGKSSLTVPGQVPQIDEGLGKSQAKRDLIALEEFLCGLAEWIVYNGELCVYRAPCWRRLSNHSAEVEIRRCLRGYNLGGPLAPGDYRELRKIMMINPDLQQPEMFDTPACKLNFVDATLDILSGEWYGHDPADGFFSYLNMSRRELEVGRNTGAFDNFVSQIADENPDVRRQLLELVGLALTGCSLKYFFVLVGPSHTGKTQFGRFLGELVGRENVETLRGIDDFGDKWTVGALRGKRMAMCLDLPDSPLPPKAVGMVKQLVGDDSVKGEYKGGALFTFYDKPLLLCAGNHPVRVPNIEKEQALLNRMVVIPFCNPIQAGEEKQQFYRALLADSAYVVRCAIDAMQDLEKRNFQVTRVPLPSEYAPTEGQHSLKAVQEFLARECSIEAGAEVTTEDLATAYSTFVGAVPLSDTEFSRLFSQAVQVLQPSVQPVKRACGGEKRGYRGLTLYN